MKLTSESTEPIDIHSRPPVNDAVPPHAFAESEFAPGCGRCDKCGGGPGAAIHQPAVDQMARIADALERIAASLESLEDIRDFLQDWDSTEGQLDIRVRP